MVKTLLAALTTALVLAAPAWAAQSPTAAYWTTTPPVWPSSGVQYWEPGAPWPWEECPGAPHVPTDWMFYYTPWSEFTEADKVDIRAKADAFLAQCKTFTAQWLLHNTVKPCGPKNLGTDGEPFTGLPFCSLNPVKVKNDETPLGPPVKIPHQASGVSPGPPVGRP